MNTAKLDYLNTPYSYRETVETYLSILEKKDITEGNRLHAAIALREKKLAEPYTTVQTLLKIITSSDEPVVVRQHCLLTLTSVHSKHKNTSAIDNSRIMSALIPIFEKTSLSSTLYWPMIHILSKLGYENMVPLLTCWVRNHGNSDYRDAIYDLELFAKQGVNAAWQALVGLIIDDRLGNCARGQAVESMKSIKDLRVLPYLLNLLGNPDLDPYLANVIHSTIETLFNHWVEDTGIRQHLYKMFEKENGVQTTTTSLDKADLSVKKNKDMPRQYPLHPAFAKYEHGAFI